MSAERGPSGTGHDTATMRCGGCGFEMTPEAMCDHIQSCEGWVTYEGAALAELAAEAGFGVAVEEPSWFARVILRRKGNYVISR